MENDNHNDQGCFEDPIATCLLMQGTGFSRNAAALASSAISKLIRASVPAPPRNEQRPARPVSLVLFDSAIHPSYLPSANDPKATSSFPVSLSVTLVGIDDDKVIELGGFDGCAAPLASEGESVSTVSAESEGAAESKGTTESFGETGFAIPVEKASPSLVFASIEKFLSGEAKIAVVKPNLPASSLAKEESGQEPFRSALRSEPSGGGSALFAAWFEEIFFNEEEDAVSRAIEEIAKASRAFKDVRGRVANHDGSGAGGSQEEAAVRLAYSWLSAVVRAAVFEVLVRSALDGTGDEQEKAIAALSSLAKHGEVEYEAKRGGICAVLDGCLATEAEKEIVRALAVDGLTEIVEQSFHCQKAMEKTIKKGREDLKSAREERDGFSKAYTDQTENTKMMAKEAAVLAAKLASVAEEQSTPRKKLFFDGLFGESRRVKKELERVDTPHS